MAAVPYERVLIKLSGEALAGTHRYGLDAESVLRIVRQIRSVRDMGVQVIVVIGGGNLFRGNMRPAQVERSTADTMGMLATVMNGLALRDFFESEGMPTAVYGSIPIPGVVEPFLRSRARNLLNQGHIVILVGGLGRPFFTTDTTAAWGALEMGCQLVIKATNVDGVYSANPAIDPNAALYTSLSYQEVLERELRVMDLTAITLLKDHALPLVVLNIHKQGNLERLFAGEPIGTMVHPARESGPDPARTA